MGVQWHVAGDRPGAGQHQAVVRFPLTRPARLSLPDFARRASVHPDLIRRFVALGLLDPTRDATGTLWFTPAQLVTVARIQRLHATLPVNYAAIGLILDLLERIDSLEAALRDTSSLRRTTSSQRTRPPGARG
jgi:chaperone modulatory protein CbpM